MPLPRGLHAASGVGSDSLLLHHGSCKCILWLRCSRVGGYCLHCLLVCGVCVCVGVCVQVCVWRRVERNTVINAIYMEEFACILCHTHTHTHTHAHTHTHTHTYSCSVPPCPRSLSEDANDRADLSATITGGRELNCGSNCTSQCFNQNCKCREDLG